mmetsp:Transcript_10535/g.23941  ORF Transcript_10535/g.23941 Transcript_10535/m.23941 type:complete len:201 (+) Transcript_10535:338-940(+)
MRQQLFGRSSAEPTTCLRINGPKATPFRGRSMSDLKSSLPSDPSAKSQSLMLLSKDTVTKTWWSLLKSNFETTPSCTFSRRSSVPSSTLQNTISPFSCALASVSSPNPHLTCDAAVGKPVIFETMLKAPSPSSPATSNFHTMSCGGSRPNLLLLVTNSSEETGSSSLGSREPPAHSTHRTTPGSSTRANSLDMRASHTIT